jgi:single-strand DNA-binding protein
MSLNSVNIMGNLTRDPELKYTNSGKSVCNLSIANNRTYTSNGEKVTEVSYFDVEVWGVVAENCAKYLAKGRGVIVEGRLKQDRWEKDGKTQSRVRIAANSIHFLPNRRDDGAGAGPQQPAANAGSSSGNQTSDAVAWDE